MNDRIAQASSDINRSIHRSLKIAVCPPEWFHFQLAMRGEPTNATYLIQGIISRHLLARGHELTFIAQRDPGLNVCTKDWNTPFPAPLSWSSGLFFEIIRKFAWHVQRILGIPYLNIFSNLKLYDACLQCLPGHDVVYERNGLYRNGVAMACRHLEIPYVLYVEADEILEHDYMAHPLTGLLRWNAKRQFRYNLMTADRIICVSKHLKAHLTKAWRIPAGKIQVFPNGVDVGQFQPDKDARREVRAALGVLENPLIIFVGNFYRWHDVGTLLDAFRVVQETYPETRLVLVGEGSTRKDMENRCKDLGVSHAVHFTGLVAHADVPRYVASADIAVVPYPHMDQENWLSPLKLFEYMASGKAIIASSVGQIVDIIEHGENGLLVSPGDPIAMADAINILITDHKLRMRLGQRARQDAMHRHSWEKYISHLEKVFYTVSS
jgi:glycosyltransferase involved in cell wall biosynthesis